MERRNKTAAISVSYLVHCDHCCKTFDCLGISRRRCAEEAEESGWRFRKGCWLCPECVETAK